MRAAAAQSSEGTGIHIPAARERIQSSRPPLIDENNERQQRRVVVSAPLEYRDASATVHTAKRTQCQNGPRRIHVEGERCEARRCRSGVEREKTPTAGRRQESAGRGFRSYCRAIGLDTWNGRWMQLAAQGRSTLGQLETANDHTLGPTWAPLLRSRLSIPLQSPLVGPQCASLTESPVSSHHGRSVIFAF